MFIDVRTRKRMGSRAVYSPRPIPSPMVDWIFIWVLRILWDRSNVKFQHDAPL